MRVQAWAKINLSLDVLNRREDGYHDLCMVMQSITLADTLTLTPKAGTQVQVASNLHFLPTGRRNLAAAAALCFFKALDRPVPGLEISIEKRIPVCAGMGGGSSDAAAVLRALNQTYDTPFTLDQLAQVGAQVGSDVPYCVLGGTALAQGRGEILTPLPPMPSCWVVVCKPDFPISTPELFARFDSIRPRNRPDTEGMLEALAQGDLPGIARRMYNVFEDVLAPRHRSLIFEIKQEMLGRGALGATMSGTGPTVFGLFDDMDRAQQAHALLAQGHRDTFLTQPV